MSPCPVTPLLSSSFSVAVRLLKETTAKNECQCTQSEKEQGTSIKGKIRLVPVSDEERKTIYEGSSAILRNLKHPAVLNVSVRTFSWQSVTVGQSRSVFGDKPADSED